MESYISHDSRQILARSPPPSLHWGIVLALSLVTGVFQIVWTFVQSAWVRSFDPASRATRDYALAFVLPIVGVFFSILFAFAAGVFTDLESEVPRWLILSLCLSLLAFLGAGVFFHMKAIFGMKSSLEHYYNTIEPIHLRLSTLMSVLFSVIYFQYHFTRIANWKRTGVLHPQKLGGQISP